MKNELGTTRTNMKPQIESQRKPLPQEAELRSALFGNNIIHTFLSDWSQTQNQGSFQPTIDWPGGSPITNIYLGEVDGQPAIIGSSNSLWYSFRALTTSARVCSVSVSATLSGPNVSITKSDTTTDCNGGAVPHVEFQLLNFLPNAEYCINGVHDFTESFDGGPVTSYHRTTQACLTTPRQIEPLIFIPGTMGSELYLKSDHEKYWIRTFSGSILGYNNYLTLDPTSEYFLGENAFSAKDALQTVNLAGYDLLSIYKPIIDRLKNDAGYIEYDLRPSLWALPTPDEGGCDRSQINTFDPSRNPTLFVFPYDFRFDNARSAEKLAAFVRCVQEFHPNKPVNLLGHSQGGLIARRYIIDHPNNHGIGKMITIATPFLGAPEAIYKLETGGVQDGIGWGALWEKGRNLPFSVGAITPRQIKFLAKHFKSVHQLLPSREYDNLSGLFGIKEIGDVNGDGIVDDYYDYDQVVAFLDNDFSTLPGSAGKSFHDCLPANLSRCQDDWRQDTSGIEYMHLVGQQSRDTTTIYLEVKNETVLIPNYPHSGFYVRKVFEPIKGPGDKTVPEISASRDDRAGTNLNAPNTRSITLASLDEDIDAEYEHNGLTQNDQVFQYVLFGLGLRSDPDFGGGGGDTLEAVSRKNTLSSNKKSEVKTSEVTTSMLNGDSLQPTPNESYYTKIIGISDVQVSDDFGNTTAQEGDVFVNNIAGLDYSVIGDDALFLSFPVSRTHFATFQAGSLPFSLEVVKGINNQLPNLAVRYKDVYVPPGTSVQLSVTNLNQIDLKYDSNSDGSYDSVIQPTASVAGPAAADRIPPTVNFNVVQQGSSATLTVSASDSQSGISRIMYSIDGQNFQVYDGPVLLQYSTTPITIYAIADDAVANRSGLYSKVFTFPQITNPTVSITAPASGAVFPVGTVINFAGSFSGDTCNTHSAVWNFDNISQLGSVNETTRSVTASHNFASAGVYLVSLAVNNTCGGTGTTNMIGDLTAMVVIYDPSGGFLTGGGWIDSPFGAYVPNPSLIGRASFGFNSKYQRGANIPTGNTEFQFRVANFNFKSASYDWLVVAGAKAQYKGSGTINNAGNYGFMLTAIDGQINGGGGADKFRIKIWDKVTDNIIYDNQLGGSDGDNPTTAIGGGSIIIHRP